MLTRERPGPWDSLLDRSIVFSYDRSGFERHAAHFPSHELENDQRGRVAVVTGASSGLGIEIARGLLAQGANVVLACRDVPKGERVLSSLGVTRGEGRVVSLDLNSFDSIRSFAATLPSRIDCLVHNAGALLDRVVPSADGLETTVATHVVGPMLLTHLLWPRLLDSADARVVFVSSGGMYAQRLDVSALFDPPLPFDGVTQYARAKRAQVCLAAMMAERAPPNIRVSSMHPGWVDTPGVETSLPRFYRWMRGRLRTPAQGADTVLFLAMADRARGAAGEFYFDRRPQPLHLRSTTEESPAERAALWARVAAAIGVEHLLG